MRALLSSQALRVVALLWVAGFTGVFMPAHRRGIVQLPGHNATVAIDGQPAVAFCPLCMSVPRDTATEDRPPADAPVNCAVCLLKVGLDLPPAVILAPAFVAEIDYLIARFDTVEAPLVATQSPIRGRAPPVA